MSTTYRQQSDNIPVIDKAPTAVLDYPMDWAAPSPIGPWLQTGETITSASCVLDPGITLLTNTPVLTPNGAATMVTPWLSGGTAGQTYTVTVHITTSQGRTDERSFRVNVIKR